MATLPRHPEMTPEQLFIAHLDHIEKVAAHAARRLRFSREEAEELASEVKLKLQENDHEVIRKFQGKSSFRTYLTTVINHMAQDHLNHIWGKWRPSAEAKRLGPVAVLLERLLVRDGLPFDQACRILRTNHRVEESQEELEELAAKLPNRNPPRRTVGEEELQGRPGTEPNPECQLLDQQRAKEKRNVLDLLKEVMATLPPEDRLIARMRGEFQVVKIAKTLRLDQKPLYRRVEKILKTLRTELVKRGVNPDDIGDILGGPDDPEGPEDQNGP